MSQDDERKLLGDALFAIVAEMVGRDLREQERPFGERTVPFDIHPENFHKDKSSFTKEIGFVRGWLDQLKKLSEVISQTGDVSHENFSKHSLVNFIDEMAKGKSVLLKPETAQELAAINVMQVGLTSASFVLNQQVKEILEDRLRDLEQQERHYWNVAHRPPNYHARSIALRLAKLFSRETGKYPTMGTLPDSSCPSTAYGRALSRTFEVLSIDLDFRGPGEWAVAQLTEKDLEPRKYVDPVRIMREAVAAGYLNKPAQE